MRGLRPSLQIFDRRSFTLRRHCLGDNPEIPAQRRERSLRSFGVPSNRWRASLIIAARMACVVVALP